MTPLSDRAAVLLIVLALGLCFALAFWAARLSGPAAPPLQWREAPARPAIPARPASGSLL
jgi:hypothetical protein